MSLCQDLSWKLLLLQCEWRHCPGTLNPADDASRGLSVNHLLHNERWFKGPAFLSKPEEDWPHIEIAALREEDPGVKNEAIFTLTVPDKLHELLKKYSSRNVLQRKIAWLLKFKVYLQHLKQKGTVSATSHKYLMTANLEKANIAIVKLVQREVYAVEIKNLENHGNVKPLSKIAKLRPVLIDGVMRIGGRISEAPVAFGAKFGPLNVKRGRAMGCNIYLPEL